jgi:3-oxoacid CoA-transferase subunit B
LTGVGVVSRIYTDLAVIDVTPEGLRVVELSPGVDFAYVQERTGTELLPAATKS